jgi:hypothetical protein
MNENLDATGENFRNHTCFEYEEISFNNYFRF